MVPWGYYFWNWVFSTPYPSVLRDGVIVLLATHDHLENVNPLLKWKQIHFLKAPVIWVSLSPLFWTWYSDLLVTYWFHLRWHLHLARNIPPSSKFCQHQDNYNMFMNDPSNIPSSKNFSLISRDFQICSTSVTLSHSYTLDSSTSLNGSIWEITISNVFCLQIGLARGQAKSNFILSLTHDP